MQAAFLVGPQQFDIREIPDPLTPQDGLVLEVKACGVCGSDLRRWKEGPAVGAGSLLSGGNRPAAAQHEGVIEGHEIGGVVLSVGPQCDRFRPGDHLAVAPDIHCGVCYYCEHGLYNLCDNLRYLGISPEFPGGFAQKLALSGEVLGNGIVHLMPAGLSFEQGALAEPCSSVLAAHAKANTGLGDVVVVMGAGPIGCLHTIVARARGAAVIVSEPSEMRRQVAQQFGPDRVVDPFNEDLAAVVRDMTGGRGADVVICANPVAATQTQAVEIVRKAGRVILFGGLPKANPLASFDANRIHYGEIVVVGAFSYHPTFHAQALDVQSRQIIPADRLITHRFGLAEIDQAFQTAASGAGLKVMVMP